jgi:hypothetical protein
MIKKSQANPKYILSVRESILQAVVERVRGLSNTGLKVFRSRRAALGRLELPAVIIEPVSDSGEGDNTTIYQDWQLLVSVRLFTRGDAPDVASEALAAQIHSALMADGQLGGLALSITGTNVTYALEFSEGTACETQLEYQINYRTPYDNWQQRM